MENKFELIFAVVNSGFEDEAMKLARSCGVTGGTLINARGTAKLEAENFFHIAVHPDKTILMMIAKSEMRDGVLHALYTGVGPNTEAQGIVFTLPVDGVSENLKNQLMKTQEEV